MFLLSIWLGKLVNTFSRLLKIGGGSAAPGYYALKLNPNLIKRLIPQIQRSIIITGTNGKTTTSRLITHFLKENQYTIINNTTGSNLERGIASTLLANTNWLGKVKKVDLAVWEIDEATLKRVVFDIKPEIVVFLNATRDQLDRYGEVDTLVKEWQQVLSKVDWNPLIILNGDDPNVTSLQKVVNHSQTFGVKNSLIKWEKISNKKVSLDLTATDIKPQGLDSISFKLQNHLTDRLPTISLPLPGTYHIYDFLAAFMVGYNLNLPVESMTNSLKGYKPAFGRVEKFTDNGYILLIKNPTGATQVLETIEPNLKTGDTVLIALNDNFADGTDVSWIWDTNFELIQSSSQVKSGDYKIICSGTRAEDMALRLKYAGIDPKQLLIEPNLSKAFNMARKNTTGSLYVLPTYTALLELQKILAKSGLKKHYWGEA